MYNFKTLLTETDSSFTWTRDESGVVHIFKRNGYYTQDKFMSVVFYPESKLTYTDFLITMNSMCEALVDLEKNKHKGENHTRGS